MTSSSLLVVVLLALSVAIEALPDWRVGNLNTETKLPKPLSDLTATVGHDNLIYLAGGCDSPLGYQYKEEAKGFRCDSISDSFYSFDPKTKEFEVLPSMPSPRFRHAAVAINNQIWIVGGRDQADQVAGTVLVYDIELGRWKTFRDLHFTYWVSDLGSFVARGKAYFVGGFTEDYRALRRVFSIDPVASLKTGRLQVERNANMIYRRGDMGITVDEDEQYAYVSGGSSQTNEFCIPLDSVERFDIVNNEWEEVAPLQQARTGKSVLQIEDHIVALGGAEQSGKLCNKTTSDPSHFQKPVHSIEVYDDGEWGVVDNLAEYRYRSASVVFDNTVYSFGGQSVYFTVCTCHPTVDDVVIYDLSAAQPDDPEYFIDTVAHSETNTLTQEPPTQLYAEGEVAGRDFAAEYNKIQGEGGQAGSINQKDGFAKSSGDLVMTSLNAFLVTALGVCAALVM